MLKRLREWAAYASATFTTTATAAANVSTLQFPVAAGEVWVVECQLTAQCSGTGGVAYAIAAPAGSTIEGWVLSSTSTITTLSYQRITAINTLTTTAVHTVATTPAPDRVVFTITAGATGTVALQAASKTSGQTTTVFANASMVAQRAA